MKLMNTKTHRQESTVTDDEEHQNELKEEADNVNIEQ